jgi:hypothetical protein
MLIGIDGTGAGPFLSFDLGGWLPPEERPGYYADMKSSFVRELVQEYQGEWGSNYFRGPTLLGEECGAIADACMKFARSPIASGAPIYLTGYSRGGAIAIEVAKRIRAEFPQVRIPVMALFDAVDRELTFGDLQTIPGNVDLVFHARRDRIVGSRVYFGNCGTKAEPPCALVQQTFVTTHGGMGGVPWGPVHSWDKELFEHGYVSQLLTVAEETYNGQVFKVAADYWLGPSSISARVVGALVGPPSSIPSFGSPAFGPNMEKQQSHLVHNWMWANLRKHGVIR